MSILIPDLCRHFYSFEPNLIPIMGNSLTLKINVIKVPMISGADIVIVKAASIGPVTVSQSTFIALG